MKRRSVLVSLALVLVAASGMLSARAEGGRAVARSLSPASGLFAGDSLFLIDTTYACVPPKSYLHSPAAAFGRLNYLVVWNDGGGTGSIRGARVSTDGTVIDTGGFPVTVTGYCADDPAIAFDGTNYLVVWDEGGSSVAGARVTANGVVLDSLGFAIPNQGGYEMTPSVAFNGTNYLVVWRNQGPTTVSIACARVSPAGILLDSESIVISERTTDAGSPSVTVGGGYFFVTWADNRNGDPDIYGARVDKDGVVLDPTGFRVSAEPDSQRLPSVAFNGVDYVAVWEDHRQGGSAHIYGSRITTSGVVRDSAGICISSAPHQQFAPSVTFDGTNCLAAWTDLRRSPEADLFGARIAPSGAVLDPDGFPISVMPWPQERPAVACGPNDCPVTWEDERIGHCWNIYAGRVSHSGVALDSVGTAVSIAPHADGSPAAASVGTDYLVAWEDRRDCPWTPRLYASRVTRSGEVLDWSGLRVCEGDWAQYWPILVGGDENYLAIWQDGRSHALLQICAARISPAGVILDPQGLVIMDTFHYLAGLAAAFDGRNYLIVWRQAPDSTESDLHGVRVSRDGEVLDPGGFPIAVGRGLCYDPSVAFGDSSYLVVWDNYDSGVVQGARVAVDGRVLDSCFLVIPGASRYYQFPAAASDGSNWFIVSRGGDGGMLGCRVSRSGSILDSTPIPLCAPNAYNSLPVLDYSNGVYTVAWPSLGAIAGCRVSPAGMVLDSFRVAATADGLEIPPALASNQGGNPLIVYQGWTSSVDNRTYNVDRIWGTVLPFGAVQERKPPSGSSPQLLASPNPFHDRVRFHVAGAAFDARRLSLTVYDAAGRLVRSLPIHRSPSQVTWDGRDNVSQLVPAGLYFCRLESGCGQPPLKIVKTD